MDKEIKKEFESLAGMVKRGFDDISMQIGYIRSDAAEHKLENEKRFDGLEKKIDQSWGLIDGYVKAQEDFRDEFKVMKHRMSQIEKVIKNKLGVTIE